MSALDDLAYYSWQLQRVKELAADQRLTPGARARYRELIPGYTALVKAAMHRVKMEARRVGK